MNTPPLFLQFDSRDELLKVDLNSVICFVAKGNYTLIVSVNGLTSMVLMSLENMYKFITPKFELAPCQFVKMGRSIIVNLNYVYRINTLNMELTLSDQRTFSHTVTLPKEALKRLKTLVCPDPRKAE